MAATMTHDTTAAGVGSVTGELRAFALRVAATLEPRAWSGEAAAAGVAELAVAEKAIATARMFLAVRVAQTDAWRGQGFASAADWLAAKAGITVTEAARQLGTAKKADGLPRTKAAMRNGKLSPTQADAVTDAATADPDAEDELLDAAAKETTKGLRDLAGRRKAAATSTAERDARIARHRSLRRGTDTEGAFWARLYGPGISAAAFEELLKPFEELVFRQHRTAGITSTHENRSFDAFFALLAHLRHQPAPAPAQPAPASPETAASPEPAAPAGETCPSETTPPEAATPSGETRPSETTPPEAVPPGTSPPGTGAPPEAPPPLGETGPPGPPGPPGAGQGPVWRPPWAPDAPIPLPAKLPGGNNVKVIVRVDHTALLRGHTTTGETCEIAGLGPIPVTAARQLLRDDAFLAVVIRKGRDVITVAHHGRGLNAHQRTALEATDLRCTNIACNHTIALEADHRIPWATNPTTHLANHDLLCPNCHRLKTHHGHTLQPGTGRRPLLPPTPPPPPTANTATDDPNDPDALEARLLTTLLHKGTPIPERLRQRATRATTRATRSTRSPEGPTPPRPPTRRPGDPTTAGPPSERRRAS